MPDDITFTTDRLPAFRAAVRDYVVVTSLRPTEAVMGAWLRGALTWEHNAESPGHRGDMIDGIRLVTVPDERSFNAVTFRGVTEEGPGVRWVYERDVVLA